MTGSERRDDGAKAPAKRLTGVGLTPAVERLFGALGDERTADCRTMPAVARRARPSERVATGSERHDDGARAPAKRLTGVGLTPAVERLFGALVDERTAAGPQPAADPEARPASRPGAA